MKWEDLLKADWEERWEGAVHPEDPSKKFLGGKLPSKTGTKDDPLLARSRKALAGQKEEERNWKNEASFNPSEPHTFSSFASRNLSEIVDAVKGKSDAEVGNMLRTLVNDIEEWIQFHIDQR
jgi:hypothetical protein